MRVVSAQTDNSQGSRIGEAMTDEAVSSRRRARRDLAVTVLSVLGAAALVGGLSASVFHASRLVATFRGNLWVQSRPLAAAAPIRFVEFRSGRRDTVALALASRPVLLLIYSSSCNVCSDNMPRWLDLVQELRAKGSDASVYAIDLDARDSLGNYWPRMLGVRRLTPLDRGAFLKLTGVPGTPASVVVHTRSVDAMVVGILGPRRRAYLISRLKA